MQHLEWKLHTSKNLFRKEKFSAFYALRQHKTNEHGIQMNSAEFDVNNSIEDDDADLKKNKNSRHVNNSSLTLSLKDEDIVFSISPCQSSTTLWLLRNWL